MESNALTESIYLHTSTLDPTFDFPTDECPPRLYGYARTPPRLTRMGCLESTSYRILGGIGVIDAALVLYLYKMTQAFLNNYKAPESRIPKGIHGSTPIEEYDFNYCFEIKTLRSDRVELRPFLVSVSGRLS
jgi:hypothetical protein